KARIMSFEQLCCAVEYSTPETNKNKARAYKGGQGWKWYNWSRMLEPAFKKLPGIKRFHHFAFSCYAPGTVNCKEFADSDPQTFDVLKKKDIKFNGEMPVEIEARGLTEERKRHLYNEVRKYVDYEYQDEFCPQHNGL